MVLEEVAIYHNFAKLVLGPRVHRRIHGLLEVCEHGFNFLLRPLVLANVFGDAENVFALCLAVDPLQFKVLHRHWFLGHLVGCSCLCRQRSESKRAKTASARGR
jgi:hypothetical protein